MSKNALVDKIARLREEIEELAAKHAEELRREGDSLDGKVCELRIKRAEILERRIRQLGEMLDVLKRRESTPGSLDTTSNPISVTQDPEKSTDSR